MVTQPIMDKKNRKYELGLYEKAMPAELSWEEKLINTKKFGFDYLEVSIDETDEKLARLEMTKQQRQELVDLMFKHDVKIQSMCLSGHRKYPLGSKDEKTLERSLEIMEKAIVFAQDLGIRIIQLAGYDVYYQEGDDLTRKIFENNLEIAAEMASKKGILLGFETMETSFMNTIEKSMVHVDRVNSPYLGVYPDIGNITNACLEYNASVVQDIAKGSGHLFAAHLKETVPNVFREVPFGTGHTDFIESIKALKQAGVRMFVGEFWYIGAKDWQQDCLDAASFLREKLDFVFDQ